MQPISESTHDGFTLLETVVATGILVTAIAGIAHLLALSVRSTDAAGTEAAALTAARDKIENLRSLAFGYGPLGEPLTDPGLASSAGDTLAEDTPGYVDYVNAAGKVVDVGADEHGAAFTRRWRVTTIDYFVPEALAIETCVFRWPARGGPRAADACVATVRARQP